MAKWITVRIHLPEEYDDVHPTLVLEDFLDSPEAFQTEIMREGHIPEEHMLCACADPIVGLNAKDSSKAICSICAREWREPMSQEHIFPCDKLGCGKCADVYESMREPNISQKETQPFVSHHVGCCIKGCDGNCYSRKP